MGIDYESAIFWWSNSLLTCDRANSRWCQWDVACFRRCNTLYAAPSGSGLDGHFQSAVCQRPFQSQWRHSVAHDNRGNCFLSDGTFGFSDILRPFLGGLRQFKKGRQSFKAIDHGFDTIVHSGLTPSILLVQRSPLQRFLHKFVSRISIFSSKDYSRKKGLQKSGNRSGISFCHNCEEILCWSGFKMSGESGKLLPLKNFP